MHQPLDLSRCGLKSCKLVEADTFVSGDAKEPLWNSEIAAKLPHNRREL